MNDRPAVPLPSATVVLVRDGEDGGAETLLVRRHDRVSFGGSYVFPGGLLDTEDDAIADCCGDFGEADAGRVLRLGSGALAYFSAGIREVFEETGLLLARDAAGGWADAGRFCDERDRLNSAELGWREFLLSGRLEPACDTLHYFDHWITPRELGKRFNTRFFLALVPPGQEAMHCGGELVDSAWLGPAAALELAERGDVRLPHPTRVTLEKLARHPTAATLVRWADERCRTGVTCRRPAIIDEDGAKKVVMPDDARYPDYGHGNA